MAKKVGPPKSPRARTRAKTKAGLPPRSHRPVLPGEAERIAVRRSKVLAARVAGGTVRQIATELGISVGTVHDDVQAELSAVCGSTTLKAEQLRDIQLARVDRVFRTLGKDMTGDDANARIRACLVTLRGVEVCSKLLGLYQETSDGATTSTLVDLSPREVAMRVEALIAYATEQRALDKKKGTTIH